MVRLGFIGGGQLGRMMTPPAKALGHEVIVLDKTPNSPAGQLADRQIEGALYDHDKLRELVEACDIVTYEIEHIDADFLMELEKEGHVLFPRPHILKLIQDKWTQNECLAAAGIPLPKYSESALPFPCVQKTRTGGYDGKGVVVHKDAASLEVNGVEAPHFFEEMVDIEMELAVNVTKTADGSLSVHPVVEMAFNDETNICDICVAPARVSDDIRERAKEVAMQAIDALGEGAVGIFAVELFLTKSGEVLVNEIAPRPHNSAHYSIEGCETSQFEQHVRAVTGTELGSTELKSPAVMVNIVGQADYTGPVFIENMEQIEAIPGVHVHMYGKAESRPERKIGHLTALGDTIEVAYERAMQAKALLK